MEQVDGKDVLTKSRALIVGDKMIVRSDDPLFTPAQIARHEAAHWQIQNGQINLGKLIRQIQKKYSTAQIREMIHLYTAAYGNHGLTGRQVLEEMVCDAMGEMNAFATEETSSVAGEVGQFLRDLRKAALETQTEGQKKNAQEGVKHSLEMDGRTQQEITQRYQQEVDSVLNMQDTTTRQLIVGYTPTVYQQLGMPSLPLTIGSGHVYSAAKTEAEAKQDGNFRKGTNYHGLGDAALKNIYKAIQDPVMVIAAKDVNKNVSPMRSTHSVVAIVDIGSAKKSLLVPIEITAERKVNGTRMDVNTISSVYEKSVKSLVTEAIAQENAGDIGIFFAKKEAMTLPGAGVQFPTQLQQSIASNSIIHRFSEKVNMNISENVQSQQFKRWFGDWQNDPAHASKVVNADGTPKVVYHGTNEDFTVFDRSKGKKRIHLNVLGDGNYFTALEQGAARYGSNVVAAYLDIKNPYVKADGFNTVADQIASEFGIARDSFTGKEVSSILRRRGYDGVVMYDGNGEIVIANAFGSNQIKSATNNIGTFDGKNPDIRYSRELTTDGRVVAVVDEDILSNLDLDNWNQETKKAAKKAAAQALLEFKDGIEVEGITRKVNKTSRDEYTRSRDSARLARNNPSAFADKMRAASVADDIIIATTQWKRDGKLMHQRADNFADFDHGTVLIESKGRQYSAEVVVGITSEGEAVFYDVVDLSPTTFEIEKVESHSAASANESLSAITGDSTSSNVAQQNENVKQKYSRELETVEGLQRQNELLQEQRDYWKEQTRTTDEKTRGADKGEVRSLANQLIRQYSSKTEVDEIMPEMQWLADSIWKNDPKISYTDLQDSAQNIARMVLDGSEVNLNAENWETGQELKRFLRGRYINVDESLKEDIGDFKAFKQSNRSLHFRENGTGTGVDSLWLELQNDFGKGLFPDSISNPGDQIRHIADTLTSLTESDMGNPYAADMELTVEQMAYDVMARAAGVNRQKATKADQAVERATEELNRLLKAGRTRERARIEQSQQTTYRQQIKNVSEKFQRMLLRPGKGATQHAPANLVGAVRSFCELFNDSEMRRAARWQLTLDTFFNYMCGYI